MQMVKVMEIKANKYKANEILKFIRQNTNLTQKEFASKINKSEDWQYSNEAGRSRYFFSDILEIVNKFDLEIIIKDKEKK